MMQLKSILLRLAGVLLLSAATLGLRAQSISLSAESWRFSGKEEFDDAFGLPQSDFGARFYDRTAWTTIDPLAEKYYSLSPYNYCAGNPIVFVDRDGRVFETAIDAISISLGVKSLVSNLQAGNIRAAVFDGVGVAIDVFAAIVPFIPGGVGYIRAAAKTIDTVDDCVDGLKFAEIAPTIGETKNLISTSSVDLSKLTPMERGRYNEVRVLENLGLTKNTKKVSGSTNTGEIRNTIPDAITTDTVYEI